MGRTLLSHVPEAFSPGSRVMALLQGSFSISEERTVVIPSGCFGLALRSSNFALAVASSELY